jgi:hypothetical protein
MLLIGLAVALAVLLMIPATHALGSYMLYLEALDNNQLTEKAGQKAVLVHGIATAQETYDAAQTAYGTVPLFCQFLSIVAVYATRVRWPSFLTRLFGIWKIFLFDIPAAPTECAGEKTLNAQLSGLELLGPVVLLSTIIGLYCAVRSLVARLVCSTKSLNSNSDTSERDEGRVVVVVPRGWEATIATGYCAMLWNMQTYLLCRGLGILRSSSATNASTSTTGIFVAAVALSIHLLTVLIFVYSLRHLRSPARRRVSYLAPLVMAYDDRRWYWFAITMLQLDLGVVAQIWITDLDTSKVIQIVLSASMLAVLWYYRPFVELGDTQVTVRLAVCSLAVQIAMAVSTIVLHHFKSHTVKVAVDIALSSTILACTACFLWVLRKQIAHTVSYILLQVCRCRKNVDTTTGVRDAESVRKSSNKKVII